LKFEMGGDLRVALDFCPHAEVGSAALDHAARIDPVLGIFRQSSSAAQRPRDRDGQGRVFAYRAG
jgi:hypothetical protein